MLENDYELSSGEVLSLTILPVGQMLRCESGVVHVRQEGRGREEVIARGGVFHPVGIGRVSVRALRAARVTVADDGLGISEPLETIESHLFDRRERRDFAA